MAEDILNTNNYQFEPVHIDWTGTRTQMIIGMLAIFCLCLVNFLPSWQIKNFCFPDCFFDFTLYFASCAAVALITLAIGKSAGNRNGAACATWAGLIFAVLPWRAIAFLPDVKASWVQSTFIILFCVLLIAPEKHKLIAPTPLIIAFMVWIFLAGGSGWDPPCFGGGVEPVSWDDPLTLVACGIASLVFCWRLIMQAISWRIAAKLIFGLWLSYTLAQAFYPDSIILGSAGLAIIVSLICLPTLGAATRHTNRLYGSLGLIALSLLAVAYAIGFYNCYAAIQ